MSEPTTLRTLAGMPATPASLADSTLIMIDLQNTYMVTARQFSVGVRRQPMIAVLGTCPARIPVTPSLTLCGGDRSTRSRFPRRRLRVGRSALTS